MISVNKIIKELAKGVMGYLRLRSIVKFHHVFSGALLLLFGPSGHFLGGYGGDSCFLGSFVVIFNLPEIKFGLQTGKNKMKGQASIKKQYGWKKCKGERSEFPYFWHRVKLAEGV